VTGAQGKGVGQGWSYDSNGNLKTAATNGVTTTNAALVAATVRLSTTV